jgi:hypothetical protein
MLPFSSPSDKGVLPKDYTNFFFKKVDESEKNYSCNLCDKTLAKDNGYSNLMAHLNRSHTDYAKIYDVQRGQDSSATLDKIWAATEDAKKIHFWMRKVVLLPEPFNYVENPIAREVIATALTVYDYNNIIKLYVFLICRG